MKYKCVYVLLCCVQYVCCFFLYTPVVEVSQGKLRGLRGSDQNRYYGIPYADSERFQPPETPRKWRGIFYAITRFGSCAQTIAIFKMGIENCQLLDVYTPETATRGQKLPVLVYIHGGAYYYGSKWNYDPEFLVKKNVIVVTVNYRVGVFGFLCLNNVANLGLKDQLSALKWIKENIAAFGGDPDNVTISGNSAGSTCASMHFLSKRSRGLFHKAILMSGVPLAPWAFNLEPLTAAAEDAAKIARIRNETDIYNTFLKSPMNDVLSATIGTSIDPRYFKYAPCIDTNFPDPFFHDLPYNTIKSGDFNKVPTMIGIADMEGILFYGLNNQRTLEYLEHKLEDRLPSIFSWCSNEDKKRIAKKIRSHYFGKRSINSKASIKGCIDFYSDWIAYAATDAFSRLLARHSDKPVYNYMFSYVGGRNYAKSVFSRGLALRGVSHADDIFYMFKPAGINFRMSSSDQMLVDRYTTMLTNFMKFGDPTPVKSELLPIRWPATTPNRTQVMRIDSELSITDMPDSHRGQFFLSLLCEHGHQGYVPCESAMKCNAKQ